MNGPIAQASALTIFGNQALRIGNGLGLWPEATVFQFCKHVTFVDIVKGDTPSEVEFAPDPERWATRLAAEQVSGLRLLHQARNQPNFDDRKLAGFIGGGARWFIEAQRETTADLWEARWRVENRDDPERKIWGVTYGRVMTGCPIAMAPDLPSADLHATLADLLPDIALFAEQHNLDSFAAAFRRAEAALTEAEPLTATYHSNLAQCRLLDLEARQLLAAAQHAWVFGGMGSWNDHSFDGEEQDRYEDLSERLYISVLASIEAASNSTLTAPVPARPSAEVPLPPPIASPAPRATPSWWARLFGRS